MSRYEHGRVLAVNEVKFGSNLVSAHTAGVTSLTVEDAADFDEAGGTLTINGQVIDYTTFDDDTGTITLAAPLAAAGDDGDRVDVYDPLYGAATSEKVAQIELDGDDGNTDPLEATIALHLQDDLDEGLRGTTGESVLLEQDGDEWRLVDVLGRSNTAGVKFYDLDTFTAAADGAQAFTLTHLPITGSVHLGWCGLTQPHTEFTVTGKSVAVPSPAGLILAGDVFDFRYAYRDNLTAPTVPADPPILVPIPGTITVVDRGFFDGGHTPSVVGTGGIWNDGSDATYAELYTTDTGPSSPTATDVANGVTAAVAVPTDPTGVVITASVRYSSLAATGWAPPRLAFYNSTTTDFLGETDATGVASTSIGWVDVPLVFDPANLLTVLGCINAGILQVRIMPPFWRGNFTYPGIRVYEAHLTVTRN